MTETIPDRCALCGRLIDPKPVEGTDPVEADGSWYEVYECEHGHEGRMEWTAGEGIERSGAIADEVVIEA